MSRLPAIVVTDEDYRRLSALLESAEADGATIDSLEEELSRATLMKRAETPQDVVTMNSHVRFRNEISGHEHEMELVYPNELQGKPDRISVLAPAGAALLGLTVGDVIDWPMPGRPPLQIKILSVSHPCA